MPKIFSNLSIFPEFTTISFPLFFLIDFLLVYQETYSKYVDPEYHSCQHYLGRTLQNEIPLKKKKIFFLPGNIQESLSTKHPVSSENPIKVNNSAEREKIAKYNICVSFRNILLFILFGFHFLSLPLITGRVGTKLQFLKRNE